MSTIRSLPVALLALAALAGCSNPDPAAPTGPAVPMPQIQSAIDASTPAAAQRGMSNKTWLWSPATGPAQIHYSTADGRDFAWVVGQRRIFAGQWQVTTGTGASGQPITQICLRHPGSTVPGLSPQWSCREGGTMFYEMTEREAGDPLRINGRTQALFVLDKTPANLAEVEARVAN
ncbi:hypothetical protein [Reyranella sp.]|uniref:hypothetical protein n=1 Tax=Reyranella sp. TaxID=1929291 RepID=UPI003BAA302F